MAAGTTDRISSTLPTRATGFVGRRRELARLEAVLADAGPVTVTGVGGVGKTLLAVQAAARSFLSSGDHPAHEAQEAREALPRGRPGSPR